MNKPEPGQGGAAKGGKGGKAGKGKVVYQVSQKVMDDYYLMQEGMCFLFHFYIYFFDFNFFFSSFKVP